MKPPRSLSVGASSTSPSDPVRTPAPGATPPPGGGASQDRSDNPLVRKLARRARLADGDRRRLTKALGPVRRLAARASIGEKDDDPRAVHVVLKGWACRTRQLADGRRQIVSLLLPGASCDPYIFLLGRRDHGVEALTPVALARISGRAIRDLSARSPALDLAFRLNSLAEAAVQCEWTVSLGRRTGVERLAPLFCELHARLAAVGLAEGDTFPMPLTQTDLGDALGQTSVHVNRTLGELRAKGLVSLRGRRLSVHDPAWLAAFAHFDPAYLHLTDKPDRP